MEQRRDGPALVMFRCARQAPGPWMGVLTAVLGGALTAVAAQYCLKLLIDGMTAAPPDRDAVMVRLGLFLGMLAGESCCWRLGGWMGSRAVIRLGTAVRLHLFELAGSQPWSFLDTVASGAVGGRIRAGSEAAAAAARTLIWNVLPPAADLVGSAAVLAAIDGRLAAGLIVAVSILTVVLHRAGMRGFPLHQAHHGETAKVAGDLADTLANMVLVRAHGALAQERMRLAALSTVEGSAHGRSWMFLERLRAGHDAMFWLVTACMMVAAVLEWSHGVITTGDVILTTTLSLRVLSGSRELALSALGLVNQLGAAREATDILAPQAGVQMDQVRLPGRPVPARLGVGPLEVQGLHYAPDRGRLFEGLDLVVPAGQRVGIVGPSGAGKSTLLRLIQGQATPRAGRILLGGTPLSALSGDEAASVFAVVTQEVMLFHRSIADNLRHGRPDAPWEAVLAAARAAGCDAFIQAMPMGYATMVGERGMRLSGGQRQRLAIARALLRTSPVLLLDEATSALDSHAELRIQQALQGCLDGRTLLAVAHRLSTVADFDRVVVLEDGRIIEDGPPGVLREGSGWFAATLRIQNGQMQHGPMEHMRENLVQEMGGVA